MTIPTIDPNVRHVGTSYLRTLNSEKLRGLEGAIVVRDNEEPLVVIVSWETFIRLQQQAQEPCLVACCNGRDLRADLREAIKSVEWAGKSDPATMTTPNKELGQYMGDVLAAVDKVLREQGDGKR